MKNLILTLGCIAGLAYATTANAQKSELVPDQNPRYMESQQKYGILSDSLTRDQGTTVQDTYKAYDWYQAREEKRALRRERNYQLSLANPYYNYSQPYYSIGFGSYGYGHRHGYGWGLSRSWYGRGW